MSQPVVHSVLFDQSDLYAPQSPAAASQPLQFYQTSYEALPAGSGYYGQQPPLHAASAGAYFGTGGPSPSHPSAGGMGAGRIGGSLAGEGWLSAFGTGGYPEEPPLLEELGINFGHIRGKTIAVLNPARQVDLRLMEDIDLAGPLIFCLAFAFFLLLSGKVHFGYIYGVAVLGTLSLHVVNTLMAPLSSPAAASVASNSTPHAAAVGASGGYTPMALYTPSLDVWKTASVLGYCLLPMVILSGVATIIPLAGWWGTIAVAVTVVWCTTAASGMLVALTRGVNQRALVAYPVGLLYACFALMTVF